MEKEEPKQLKLTPKDPPKATHSGGQGKREKEEKGSKWVVITILIVSMIISLFFYFSGRRGVGDQKNQLGGVKVYKF